MMNDSAFDANFPVTPNTLKFLISKLSSRENSRGNIKPMQTAFIWGAPGVGKTDIVRQVADEYGCRLVALHLPQFDPTDVKGIPVRMDDGTVRWVPSSYMAQQYKVRGVSETTHEMSFHYAESVAVYLITKTGEEIFRWNDSTMPDIDKDNIGGVEVNRDGTDWTVTLGGLPAEPVDLVVVDKSLIFLDELSAADPTTQKAALQLVLDRRVGDYEVPHSVPLVAAGNRECDGAYVQAFNHPLANRLAHFTLIPSVSDWIDWAWEKRKPAEVIGFVKWMGRDALYSYEPSSLSNGNFGFSTPRSLAMLADQFEPLSVYEGAFPQDDAASAMAKTLRMTEYVGMVGAKTASAFVAYLEVMHDMPHPDEVVSGKAKEIGNVERSQSFGLLYALVFRLESEFLEHYETGVDKWEEARENILTFITNNFEAEAGAWVNAVIFGKTKIAAKAIRGDAFLAFAKKYVNTAAMV